MTTLEAVKGVSGDTTMRQRRHDSDSPPPKLNYVYCYTVPGPCTTRVLAWHEMDGSYQFYTLEFGTHRTARSVCGGYSTKFDPTRNSHWSGFVQGPACFQKLGGFGPFSTLFPSFFKDRTPGKKQTGGCHIYNRSSFFQKSTSPTRNSHLEKAFRSRARYCTRRYETNEISKNGTGPNGWLLALIFKVNVWYFMAFISVVGCL